MSVKAIAKPVRVSPRKVGEVVALIRGRTVEDALVILENTPRRAAQPLIKLVRSVIANAENNHGYDPKGLQIISITVGPGLTMKRYRPAAMGRALPYRKRTSIVEIIVDGKKRKAKPKKASSKSSAKKDSKDTDSKKADVESTDNKEKA